MFNLNRAAKANKHSRMHARKYTRRNIEPFEAWNERPGAVNSLNLIYFKVLSTRAIIRHHIFSFCALITFFNERPPEIHLTSQSRVLWYSDKSFTVKLSSLSQLNYHELSGTIKYQLWTLRSRVI